MTRTLPIVIAMTCLVACGGGDKDDTGNPSDDTSSSDTGNGSVSDDAPSITNADAYCELHDVGDKYYQWTLSASATDPQGLDTIVRYDSSGESNYAVVLSSAGGEVARYGLTCADGNCFGSFKEAEDGVSCSNSTSYTFQFFVSDEDGNTSAAFEVTGRQE